MILPPIEKFHTQSNLKLPPGTNTTGITFMEPELERRIARTCAITTKLVRDGADKDDLRGAFAGLAKLKARRHPIDVYRIECLMNLGDFL